MAEQKIEYVQLNVSTGEFAPLRWFRVRRDVAESYGWTDAYPIAGETPMDPPVERRFLTYNPRRFRPDVGGRKIKISREPRRNVLTAGKVNQFRISRNCSNSDLAELAYLTKGEWHWMETAHGDLWSREEWLGHF